jgi:threonine/homoserine/homoserine lactone efflux protein
MDVSLVLRFWVIAVLLALTPGADWAYAIAAGLQTRSVVPSILGIISGHAALVAAVVLGVGALITGYPFALTVLTLAGAGYLIFLSVSTLLRKAEHIAVTERPMEDRRLAQFVRGAGVSGSNPKSLLLMFALLPQFTSPTGWAPPLQMGALGGLHVLNCAVVYFMVALLARRLVRSRPRAREIVSKTSGVLMTLIGLGILAEQLVHLP